MSFHPTLLIEVHQMVSMMQLDVTFFNALLFLNSLKNSKTV